MMSCGSNRPLQTSSMDVRMAPLVMPLFGSVLGKKSPSSSYLYLYRLESVVGLSIGPYSKDSKIGPQAHGKPSTWTGRWSTRGDPWRRCGTISSSQGLSVCRSQCDLGTAGIRGPGWSTFHRPFSRDRFGSK